MPDVRGILVPFINARRDRAADEVRILLPTVDPEQGAVLVFENAEEAGAAVQQMGKAVAALAERRRWIDRAPRPAAPSSPARLRVVPPHKQPPE